jgi:hypothetical protein
MKIIECQLSKSIKSIDDIKVNEIFQEYLTTSKTGSIKLVFPQGGIKYINTDLCDTYTIIPSGNQKIMVFTSSYDINRIKRVYLHDYLIDLRRKINNHKSLIEKMQTLVKNWESSALDISDDLIFELSTDEHGINLPEATCLMLGKNLVSIPINEEINETNS